jgi:hypothetical protein
VGCGTAEAVPLSETNAGENVGCGIHSASLRTGSEAEVAGRASFRGERGKEHISGAKARIDFAAVCRD